MSFVKNARLLAARGARLAQNRSYSDEMKLTFAAANKTFYDAAVVRQIDVPSFSGSFGILAKHVPTLAVLKPGVVQVVENDGKLIKFFVSSGSVTVNEDSSVQVLAEEAHNVEDIDANEARQLLSKYQSELSSAGDDKAKAQAAIAVEVAEALVKAAE
ncbi:ATP synthase subunit delta, mitochondrial [Drosophila suzukii]|uniref:ATP synthase F(1) complex subunit delta, mitochondrial n=1 Tax=Drosophila suzukii TaxID=28584 RepID=A0AB39ZJQ4_DROSZ|nr:ATP synthase subunit delta, mitochondrial [Drosophila suzukii]XP_037725049.1 ATP synthase subunit delta, mitochondrial [Drosophila subpulchrella]